RAGLHPVLVAQRAARLLVGVATQVDAVVDERDRGADPTLRLDLLDDRPRHGDELVHLWRQPTQLLAILDRPHAGRVDSRDDVWLRPPEEAEGEGCSGPDRFGPEHVVVDDVGIDL